MSVIIYTSVQSTLQDIANCLKRLQDVLLFHWLEVGPRVSLSDKTQFSHFYPALKLLQCYLNQMCSFDSWNSPSGCLQPNNKQHFNVSKYMKNTNAQLLTNFMHNRARLLHLRVSKVDEFTNKHIIFFSPNSTNPIKIESVLTLITWRRSKESLQRSQQVWQF